jgi:hypothetical protein
MAPVSIPPPRRESKSEEPVEIVMRSFVISNLSVAWRGEGGEGEGEESQRRDPQR